MAQISIINIKDIIQVKRFDAEYFKPEYLYRENILYKTSKPLNFFMLNGNYGVLPKSDDYDEHGIPLIRGKDIRGLYLDYKDLIKVPKKYFDEKYHAEIGDILILVKGATIANPDGVFLVNKELPNNIFNGSVFRIRLKNNINRYFLFVYMQTRYFTYQKERLVANNGIEYNSLNDIKNYLIPNLSQSFQIQIEKIVKEVYQKQSLSKQLYNEAEYILLEELDLVDFKPKHKLTFTTTKKEIEEAKRFDAEYFQPKYEEIIEKIKSYKEGWDFVGNIVNWGKGIEVGSEAYTEEGKDFVRVSDFSKFGIENVSKKIDEKLFDEIKDEFQPKKGEILFTKDGTIGISYVIKENIEGVLSGAFLRLTLKDKYKNSQKEVLALIFNSIITKLQVEKLSGGALIAHLKPSDFEKFIFPLIFPQIQTQIAQKIKESFKLRKEAKELLEKAKKMVEEEIEKANPKQNV